MRTLFIRLSAGALWLGLAALLVAGAANALSISYYLDQTNTTVLTDPDGALPDGDNYLTVTLADDGDDILVTVTLLSPLTDIADANFGIQSFFFNSINNNVTEGSIIGLPTGWNANVPPPPNPGDGFGQFEVRVADAGMARQNPTLSFSISIAGDSIDDYAEALTGGSEGAYFFAAHVTGFVDQNSLDPVDPIDDEGLCTVDSEGNYSPGCNILTSAWFGGSTIVPEPSTALLVFAGLALLGLRRRG